MSRLMTLVVGIAIGVSGPAAASPESLEEARRLLARAFENRYDVDFSARIELAMVDERGRERVRRFRAFSKVIDERTHSVGRLVEPGYLRGMTLLTIEAPGRGHDAFIYLPSLAKVRRISTAQRADAFLGSDVTYEDLERRRIGDYTIRSAEDGMRAEEPTLRIRAEHRRSSRHPGTLFVVATRDAAILETRDLGNDGSVARIVEMPRAQMVTQGKRVVPARMIVRNVARTSHTVVVFHDLVLSPEIDDHLFALSTIEQRRPLPGEDER